MTDNRLKFTWKKKGFVFKAENVARAWVSHCMAPAPVVISNEVIRVFMGGWDENKISRIWYVDVDIHDPSKVLNVSQSPSLDIGEDGCFDENGVFPGHITREGNKYFMYYTGFQLGHKIRHYNFGGLAESTDGVHFKRVSQAPVLDRKDEGLHVRAGQSIIFEDSCYHSCYSAGSGWMDVGGKRRPVYEVYYQKSDSKTEWKSHGQKIVSIEEGVEHGLGRPQIFKFNGQFYVFYTRRTLDFRYHLGASSSKDLVTWQRCDDWVNLPFGNASFDSEMVYFPAVVDTGSQLVLFYSGNEFGKDGMGYATLEY